MAKNKIKKIVKVKDHIEDEDLKFRQLIIIFAVMILLCVGAYLLTDKLIEKKVKDPVSSSEEIEIAYDAILLGDILSQKEKEYYVLAIDFKSKDFEDYETILEDYKYGKEEKTVYKSNLNDGLNKVYTGEESNPKAKTVKELKVSGTTLIFVKENKIAGYYEGIVKINEVLK